MPRHENPKRPNPYMHREFCEQNTIQQGFLNGLLVPRAVCANLLD